MLASLLAAAPGAAAYDGGFDDQYLLPLAGDGAVVEDVEGGFRLLNGDDRWAYLRFVVRPWVDRCWAGYRLTVDAAAFTTAPRWRIGQPGQWEIVGPSRILPGGASVEIRRDRSADFAVDIYTEWYGG